MDKIISKFSSIDLFGYFFNGCSFFIWVVVILWIIEWDWLIYFQQYQSIDFFEWFAFVLWAYLFGHFLQSVFIFIEKLIPKKKFRNKEVKEYGNSQIESIAKKYDIEIDDKKWYRTANSHRYLTVLNSWFAWHVEVFNTIHYFYKWFFSVFFWLTIVSIIVLLLWIVSCNSQMNYIQIIIFTVVCWLFWYLFLVRMHKFYDYLSEKINVAYNILEKTKTKEK